MITHTYEVLRPVSSEDPARARSAQAFWSSQAARFECLGRSYRQLRWTCWGLSMLLAAGAGSALSREGLGYALPWVAGFAVLLWIGVLAGELQRRAMVSENARLALALAAAEAADLAERALEQPPVAEVCSGKAFVECHSCGVRDELTVVGRIGGSRSQPRFDGDVRDELFPTRIYAIVPERRIWRRRSTAEAAPAPLAAPLLDDRHRGRRTEYAWFCSNCSSDVEGAIGAHEEMH